MGVIQTVESWSCIAKDSHDTISGTQDFRYYPNYQRHSFSTILGTAIVYDLFSNLKKKKKAYSEPSNSSEEKVLKSADI